MGGDGDNGSNERVEGTVMVGTIFFCIVVGIGVGAFLEQPLAGALVGAALGILLGLWVVPGLLRELD